MRFDIRDQFSDKQVITVTAVSTNSKTKKNIKQDLGIGCADLGLAVFIDEDAVGGGGSLAVELIEADDAALTSNVVSLATLTIPYAKLKAGKSFFLNMPGDVTTKKFFGARYTPTTVTSVKVSSYFGARQDVANYKSFDSTYSVDN